MAISRESGRSGVESARWRSWGSAQPAARGLKLRPYLAACAWLAFRGNELEQRKDEINLRWALEPADLRGEYWRFRFNKRRRAIVLAQPLGNAGYVATG